ncbi:MAG: hypothetical protein LBI90_04845, partial [Treponema sp.]|nr:hypothetical protein [Treponema sp.]
KSGCVIEKLQERSIEKSTALIVMYSIIAVMIMNMTYAARLTPDMSRSSLELYGGEVHCGFFAALVLCIILFVLFKRIGIACPK